MNDNKLTRDYLCIECHGALVEKFINDKWIVICATDEKHNGVISKTKVAAQQTLDRLKYAEVMSFYGPLLGIREDQSKSGGIALYGTDEPLC